LLTVAAELEMRNVIHQLSNKVVTLEEVIKTLNEEVMSLQPEKVAEN
jgi:hypothetical protein